MNRSRLFVLFMMLALGLLLGSSSAWAHNETIPETFELELGDEPVSFTHDDQSDWKGFLTLTVTNTGDDPWGDFHFYLDPSDSVVFATGLGAPYMTGVTGFSSTYDDDFHTLNFYFYGDPIENGDLATFTVYTDNTKEKLGFFSISMKASPVPLPAAAWLLGSGVVGMIAVRRRKK